MALDYVTPGDMITFPASADITAIMRILELTNSSGLGKVSLANGTADILVGISANKPKSGEGAEVQYRGKARVVASAAISVNDFIGSNAQGFGVAVTTINSSYVGRAVSAAGGSGEIFEVLISPGKLWA